MLLYQSVVIQDPVCTAYLRGSDGLHRCKVLTVYEWEKGLLAR